MVPLISGKPPYRYIVQRLGLRAEGRDMVHRAQRGYLGSKGSPYRYKLYGCMDLLGKIFLPASS